MTHGCSESEGCSNDGQHSKDRKSNRVYTPDLRMKLAVTNKDLSYIHILDHISAAYCICIDIHRETHTYTILYLFRD
jgi:hypothetical protein